MKRFCFILFLFIAHASYAGTAEDSLYQIFRQHYLDNYNKGEPFLGSIQSAAKQSFSLDNPVMRNLVIARQKQGIAKADTTVIRIIAQDIGNKFIDQDFLEIECNSNATVLEPAMKGYGEYACNCATTELKPLREHEAIQLMRKVSEDCGRKFAEEQQLVAKLQEEVQKLSDVQKQAMGNCIGKYVVATCPFFRNTLLSDCKSAAHGAFRTLRKDNREQLEKKLEAAAMGRSGQPDKLFASSDAHKQAVTEWGKAGKLLSTYKTSANFKQVFYNEGEISTGWIINPGPKAEVLFLLNYTIEWELDKPIVTHTEFVPANKVKEKKRYLIQATSDDMPPPVVELEK